MRNYQPVDLTSIFTEEEQDALALLTKRGFKAFAQARLEDVHELDGSRHRTFRNQGRYDLVLALKKAEPAQEAKTEDEPATEPEPEKSPDLESMTRKELLAVAEDIDDIPASAKRNKTTLVAAIKKRADD